MCVIIDKPCGESLEFSKLYSAASHNKDGMGVMYVSPETGKFTVERYLPKDVWSGQDIIEKRFEVLKNVHAVFHLRYRTHGDISLANTHPFKILDKAKHGKDLYFMHNGMINIESSNPKDKGKSDTILFSETILKPALSRDPDLLHEDYFQALIEEYIGYSKLLFMDNDGVITRFGEWETNENCIVSNNSYFTRWNARSNTSYNNDASDTYSDDYWKKYDAAEKETNPTVFTPKTTTSPPLIGFKPASVEGVKQDNDALERVRFLKEKANVELSDNRETVDRKEEPDEVDERFHDMVMVHDVMKSIDDVRLEDLSALAASNDIYDLMCDFPEKMADLMQELIDYNLSLENLKMYSY